MEKINFFPVMEKINPFPVKGKINSFLLQTDAIFLVMIGVYFVREKKHAVRPYFERVRDVLRLCFDFIAFD